MKIMRLQKKFRFLALPLLLVVAIDSWAAGLGGIDLDSFLGQPLTARIQLLGVPTDQVSTVSARLASASDYRIMGLDQSKLNIPLTFTPTVWRGKAVIEVRSVTAVKDPILQFAIDVSWQHGHLLREYILFLDPPTVAVAPPRKSNPVKTASRSSSNNITNNTQANENKTSENKTIGKEINEIKPVVQTILSNGAQSQAGEYGPVRSGETLWAIANNWSQQSSANVNQAMVAIVRLNPEDFVNGDINRMNRGAILRLPTAEDIADITVQEANSIVSQQISAWREQTTQTAAPPILSAVAEEPQAETPKIKPDLAATDQPVDIKDDALARITDSRLEQAAASEEINADIVADIASNSDSLDDADAGGLLELVPPAEDEIAELNRQLPGSAAGNDTPDTASTSKIENRLAVTEEDLVATQEQNALLQAQVSQMQAEIDALREGLNLNDNELAVMQKQMAATTPDTETQSISRDETPKQATRMLKKDDKSLLARWWWLGLLVLTAVVAYLVYRSRNNTSTEAQAETNFLDSMLESKQAREFKDDVKGDKESLAADAEKILEVLEKGDAEVEDQFSQSARKDADELSRDAASNAKDEAAAEAVEIKKFLDQVEADKAALAGHSDDALDHTEANSTTAQRQEDNTGSSAEEEILESLENDDDSDSEQATDNSTEEKIEVKLDLARAYLAMKDKPAAQAILDEVMLMGSEQQQLEARSMLDEIE